MAVSGVRSHDALGQPMEEQKRLGPPLESPVEGRFLWPSHRCHARKLRQIAHAAGVLMQMPTMGIPLSGSLMAVSALLLIVPPKFMRWRAL